MDDSTDTRAGHSEKKGCLGCLPVLAIVTVCIVAGVAAQAYLSNIRSHGGAELRAAAEAGDVERVTTLLGFGRRWLVDVNDGALAAAAGEGHVEVARLLIAAGAEIDRFPLNEAARNGQADVISLLLESGADPNAANYPTQAAAQNVVGNVFGFWLGGQREWKEYAKPSYYPAALHLAIENGHTDVAALLIHAGANVLAPGPPVPGGPGNRLTAVERATSHGQADMVALLEAAAELPLPINVLNAARAGDWERLSRLVALGTDVNARTPLDEDSATRGYTALDFAERAEREDIASMLRERGATER